MRKVFMGTVIGAMAAILPAMVTAEAGQTLFTGGAGYLFFDSDRDVEDATVGIMALEYHLTDRDALEFRYMQSSPSPDVGRGEYDLYQGNLNMIRYFGDWEQTKPYAGFGIGMSVLEDDDNGLGDRHDLSEVQANLGVGVRYWVDSHWSARLGVEAIKGFDDGDTDTLLGLVVSYAMDPGPVVLRIFSDDDNDGVRNRDDSCPGTPGGVGVDAEGCSLDSDKDGVPDYRDKCAQTSLGREVDQFGCRFVLRETVEMIARVQFPTNSADIPEAYQPEIARIAEFLTRYAGVEAVIKGHTDNSGAAAYNKSLSLRRAQSVMNALIARYKINASRLSAEGYGEEEPIADNNTQPGRQANRRVIVEMQAEVFK